MKTQAEKFVIGAKFKPFENVEKLAKKAASGRISVEESEGFRFFRFRDGSTLGLSVNGSHYMVAQV
jgi:hypothetical protein